jgi:hypothetical protein
MFPEGILQDGRLASRRPGINGGCQQIEACFVYEDDGSLFSYGFFFNSGHFSSRHCSIAPSSRWLARCTGFCRLQPMLRKRLPTCWGVYATLNSRLMTSATRGRVHTSPRNPYASAPLANKVGSSANCSSLSRRFGPPALRLYSALTPALLALLSHWLTAPGVTPKASAILLCFHPCCLSSQARSRRASRQSCGFLFAMSATLSEHDRKFKNSYSSQ